MFTVAVVTDGTRGIGLAVARALSAGGCTVTAVYRGNQPAAEQCAAESGAAIFRWDMPKASLGTGSLLTVSGGQYIADG